MGYPWVTPGFKNRASVETAMKWLADDWRRLVAVCRWRWERRQRRRAETTTRQTSPIRRSRSGQYI